jgi:hypothetical protein
VLTAVSAAKMLETLEWSKCVSFLKDAETISIPFWRIFKELTDRFKSPPSA